VERLGALGERLREATTTTVIPIEPPQAATRNLLGSE
jgi:hypothetical protein